MSTWYILNKMYLITFMYHYKPPYSPLILVLSIAFILKLKHNQLNGKIVDGQAKIHLAI